MTAPHALAAATEVVVRPQARAEAPAGEPEPPQAPAEAAPRVPWWDRLVGLAVLVVLAGVTVWVGVVSRDFVGFPKGYDALGHMADVRLTIVNFPHLLWNAAWYSGTPGFPGRYGPGYTWAVAAAQALGGLGIARTMVLFAAAINVVTVCALYGLVRVVGRSRLAAAGAALIFLALPTFWAQTQLRGLYPRMIALALCALASYFTAAWARHGGKLRFAGATLSLAAALLSHPVIGVLGVGQVALLALLVPGAGRRRFRRTASLLAVTAGLVAFFYVPYAVRPHTYWMPGLGKVLNISTPVPWRTLIGVANVPLDGLNLALVPLAVVLVLAAGALSVRLLAVHRAGRTDAVADRWRAFGFPVRAAVALGVASVGIFAWVYLGNVVAVPLDIRGVEPIDLLVYGAWPLAALVGILAGGAGALARARALRLVPGVVLVAAGALSLAGTVPVIRGHDISENGPVHHQLMAMVPKAHPSNQERLAGTSDLVTEWLNVVTSAPENRGYFNQDIIQPNYQAWMETTLASNSSSAAELAFMTDWYALGAMFTSPGQHQAFASQPSAFHLVARGAGGYDYRLYDVAHPSPILAASGAPTLLVVGGQNHYGYVLHALAQAGVGSGQVVPVEGPTNLSTYSLAELQAFPAVMLYGSYASNPAEAAATLAAYVRHGGHLFVDLADEPAMLGALEQADPGLLPEVGARPYTVTGQWDFAGAWALQDKGIRFSAFSPPAFAGTSGWAVESGTPRRRAEVLLASHGHPVVATAPMGAGEVTESGLALPYHAVAFGNAVEATYLAQLLDLPTPRAVTGGRAAIVNNDAATVSVPAGSAHRGVLFKETDYTDWHATVNGKPATIWPAGPGMMYVQLGPEASTVAFTYRLSKVEWGGVVLTVGTFGGLALWVAWGPLLPLRRRLSGAWRTWSRPRRRRGRGSPAPG